MSLPSLRKRWDTGIILLFFLATFVVFLHVLLVVYLSMPVVFRSHYRGFQEHFGT